MLDTTKNLKKVTYEGVEFPIELGIEPSGTIQLTENNKTYDVRHYANAEVSVEVGAEFILKEGDILGKWGIDARVWSSWLFDFKPNGVLNFNIDGTVLNGTYTLSGTEIICATDDATTVLTYNREEEAIYLEDTALMKIPQKLIEGSATTNGTYNANEEDADGYSKFVVNVSAGGEGEESSMIEIVMPSEFGDLTSDMFFHKATDDIILFSSRGITGIWEYRISTKTFTQVNSSRFFSSMHSLTNGNCIFCDPGNGVFVYNPNTKQIVASTTSSAGKRVWNEYHSTLDGNCLLGGKKDNAKGVLLYNVETGTFSSTGSYDTHLYFQDLPDGDCLIGSASYGFVRYDSVEKKLVSMGSVSSGMFFHVLPNGDCLVGGNSTNGGLWLYDATEKTMTQIYLNSTYGWNIFYDLPSGKTIVSGTNSSYSKGIIVYNHATKTATRPYSTGYNFMWGKQVSNGGLLLGSPNANGVTYYNPVDDTVTVLFSSIASWSAYHDLPNGDLLIGNSYDYSTYNSGVCLYSADSNTVTQIWSIGYRYINFENLPDGNVYITSDRLNKNLLYDGNTKKIRLYSVTIQD
jgi:hypothetical protein